MKLLSLTSIFFVMLILGGCSTSQQSGGMTDEQIFEKKQECAKYKDSLQKDIEKEISTNSNYCHYSKWIEEIFYNKKENSCFAELNTTQSLNCGDENIRYYEIKDLLSNKTVAITNSLSPNPGYYEIKNELKGE